MTTDKKTGTDEARQQAEEQILPTTGPAKDSGWIEQARGSRRSEQEQMPLAEYAEPQAGKPKTSQGRKRDEEEYARRFLEIRKVKEYTPVYIDVRMKEKLQTLISSLQHLAPDITPTLLLSNLLADHIAANRDLITRVANEGLKRSLASTFDNEKQ